MKKTCLLIVLLFLVALVSAQDTLRLKSGKTVAGKILSLSDGKIKVAAGNDTLQFIPEEISMIQFCDTVKSKRGDDCYCNNNISSISGSSNTPDKGKQAYKEVHNHFEKRTDDVNTEKQLKIESESSEKPYWTINGRSFVMSRDDWATTNNFTDIIFVDGKRMTPDEVNKNIKRSSINGVGAMDGEAAQNKYGLNQPVLEIYINTSPETDITLLPAAKEQEALLKEQEAKIKEQKRLYNERKHLYEQQRQLAMQEKWQHEEILQQQKSALEKQQLLIEKQEEQVRMQAEQVKEQEEQVKEQREMMNAVKQEMLKDSLIQQDEHYELILNSREMLINGKKQAASVHQKYIELINSKRKKAFSINEEWKIKE